MTSQPAAKPTIAPPHTVCDRVPHHPHSSPHPKIAKQEWNSRYDQKIPHTADYYLKCIGGGILSCGLTHTAVCPLDVVKINMQVNPQKYKGLISGLRILVAEEGMGAAGCFKGWAPTLLGYSAQGAFKFGLYEVFKDFYANLLGEEIAKKWMGAVWLSASASAEFFADAALCPLEMVKVKMQANKAGTVPLQLGAAITYMRTTPGTGFPFRSIGPLWSRQIPYTMAMFYCFERIVRFFYTLSSLIPASRIRNPLG